MTDTENPKRFIPSASEYIGEIRIYNRKPSAAGIEHLYNGAP
jgi:hypothetical protein